MNYFRDLIHRLRSGDGERRIARDLHISRPTVHKYHLLAEQHGFLVAGSPLPDEATLAAALGPAAHPPTQPSTVAPHDEVVRALLDQGVEANIARSRLVNTPDHKW